MASEIVVDTNVFAHSYNDIEQRGAAALGLIAKIRDGDQILCLDEGFNVDESKNRSAIAGEYRQRLDPACAGIALVSMLARSGRVRIFPKRPARDVYRRIMRLGVRDNVDRVFVGVACQTTSRIFVSHDFVDFPMPIRDTLQRDFDVRVIEADEFNATCS